MDLWCSSFFGDSLLAHDLYRSDELCRSSYYYISSLSLLRGFPPVCRCRPSVYPAKDSWLVQRHLFAPGSANCELLSSTAVTSVRRPISAGSARTSDSGLQIGSSATRQFPRHCSVSLGCECHWCSSGPRGTASQFERPPSECVVSCR